MSNPNVAYVLLRFPFLTETFVAEEIREVQNKGVKVHLFSLLAPKKEPIHPVSAALLPQVRYAPAVSSLSLWWAQLYFLFKTPGRYFRLLWNLLSQPTPAFSFLPRRLVIFLKSIWLAKELDQSPVQSVHTHFAWLSAAAGMVVSELLDLPFTITTHAYDIYSPSSDLFNLTTSKADRIVTISEYNKRAMLEKNSALNRDRIQVIHCGINLTDFRTNGQKAASTTFQITSVGSLIEKKGHEYLIRACKELDDEGLDFRCVIVGGGGLKQPLNLMIEELNLTDKVSLAGTQTQQWVRDRLSKSDLFGLACVVAKDGERDGIPVAMMEALAMKVPVVTTPVSGIPELVRHNETGLLAPEKDVKELAAAIARLIRDESLRKKLGENGRALVEAEYNISENADQMARMFQQMIEEQAK